MDRDFGRNSDDSENLDEACEAARHFLSKVFVKTVKVPKFLLTAVEKFNGSLDVRKANTRSLRNALKNSPAVLENETRYSKLLLLEFAISDENFDQMNGVKLIPISDGSFRRFDSDSVNPVFVDSDEHPRLLLPLLKNWFVDKDVPGNIWPSLEKAAKTNCNYSEFMKIQFKSLKYYQKHFPINSKLIFEIV